MDELAIRRHPAEGAVIGPARLDPGCPGEIGRREEPEHHEERRICHARRFEYPIAGRLQGKLQALASGRLGSLVEVHRVLQSGDRELYSSSRIA